MGMVDLHFGSFVGGIFESLFDTYPNVDVPRSLFYSLGFAIGEVVKDASPPECIDYCYPVVINRSQLRMDCRFICSIFESQGRPYTFNPGSVSVEFITRSECLLEAWFGLWDSNSKFSTKWRESSDWPKAADEWSFHYSNRFEPRKSMPDFWEVST
jgi:hypothetical protein